MSSPPPEDAAFLRDAGFVYDPARNSWVGPMTWSPGLYETLVVEPATHHPAPNRAMRRRRRRRKR